MDDLSPGVSAEQLHLDPLFVEVYDRLKTLASRQRIRGGEPLTLCTTELVHETYLRVEDSEFKYEDPGKFFAYAARAMRFILTDAARRRIQSKRGGDLLRLSLTDPAVNSSSINPELAIELDDAICALEREDPRAARVMELHYFAGLDMDKVAEVLGVVRRTVERDWRYVRAFIAARAEG